MRDLTQREVQTLTSARTLLHTLENEHQHSAEKYDGYLAAKAGTAEDSIFDFLNSKAAYGDDKRARHGVDPDALKRRRS